MLENVLLEEKFSKVESYGEVNFLRQVQRIIKLYNNTFENMGEEIKDLIDGDLEELIRLFVGTVSYPDRNSLCWKLWSYRNEFILCPFPSETYRDLMYEKIDFDFSTIFDIIFETQLSEEQQVNNNLCDEISKIVRSYEKEIFEEFNKLFV